MTCRTLEDFYHIDGHLFEKQYKEVLSGFRQLNQLDHADEWLLFEENIGPHLAIDESSLSNGELYTFVTNRDARTRQKSLVAVVSGTKSEDVISVLERIDENRRNIVEEVTLDLSDSMRKIVRRAFPNASRVIDRFHIQKLACEAVQELRIKHRWDAIQESNDEMENAKLEGEAYKPFRFGNGIHARNYWHAQGFCFSSLQTTGAHVRNNGLQSCLKNIPTSRLHMDCVILCA